jgi:hypothetical protein
MRSAASTGWAATFNTERNMKVFRVLAEHDGETTKVPGKVSTELVRAEYRYAANTMQEVWDAIEWLRNDHEETIIAIHEEAPAITVLTPNV